MTRLFTSRYTPPVLLVFVGVLVLAVMALGINSSPGFRVAPQAGGADSANPQLPPIEQAGPLPVVTAAGPLAPPGAKWPASVLTGSGNSRSPRPWLEVPASASGSKVFQVFDASEGVDTTDAPTWQGQTSERRIQTGDNKAELRDGHIYLWRWRPLASAESWSQEYQFAVNTDGGDNQSTTSAGGISVDKITGLPTLSWTGASLPGPAGAIAIGASWQPGRAPAPGLPSGWRLEPTTGSTWGSLSESKPTTPVAGSEQPPLAAGSIQTAPTSPESVHISAWGSGGLTFTRNAAGIYAQAWALHGPKPRGVSNSLTVTGTDQARQWTLTELDGTATHFANGRAISVWHLGQPMSDISYSPEGALTRLTSPSGSEITVKYADGEGGGCASGKWTIFGFEKPPANAMCEVDYSGGASTQVGYANGGRIAMMKDAGNLATTYRWDSVGRVAGVRAGLPTQAASIDDSYKSQSSAIGYVANGGNEGRVSTILEAAPTSGAAQTGMSIEYPDITPNAVLAKESTKSVLRQIAGKGGVVTRETGPIIKRTTIAAVDWRPSAIVDRAGREATLTYDAQGKISQITDPANADTKFNYDDAGRTIGTTGPADNRDSGPSTTTEFDRDAAGDPWTGFAAIAWPNADMSSDDSVASFWKLDPGKSVSFDWNKPEVGSGKWSARAQSTWKPDPKTSAGDWWFKPEAGGGSVRLFVDGQECDTGTKTTCKLTLAPGQHHLVIEVSNKSTDGKGWVSIGAGRNADQITPMSAKDVAPGYGVSTRLITNDTYVGSAANPGVTSEFDKPWRNQPTVQRTAAGAETKHTYENLDWQASRWGRDTSMTTPGGKTQTITYWGNTQKPDAAPQQCDVPDASQAGQIRTLTRVDGTKAETWYDAAGRTVASVATGSNGATETTCSAHDEAGRPRETATYDGSGSMVEHSTTNYAVDGKPWMFSVTDTHGPEHPVSPNATTTTTSTQDMNGRLVKYVDAWGVTTMTGYTEDGSVGSTTVTPPGPGATPYRMVNSYVSDGSLEAVSVNDQKVATVTKWWRSGRVKTIAYQGGAVLDLDYSNAGVVNDQNLKVGSSTFSSYVRTTGAGRITSSGLAVSGPQSGTEKRSYGYDKSGRLAAAAIKQVAGPDQNFDYTFGTQEDSCNGGFANAGLDSIRTGGKRGATPFVACHDSDGRLTSTTDPLITGGSGTATATHDDMGRLRSISGQQPIEYRYAAGPMPVSFKEGSGDKTKTTTTDRFGNQIVTKTVEQGGKKSAVRYGYAGPGAANPTVLMDTSGRVDSVTVMLPGGIQAQFAGSTIVGRVTDVRGAALTDIPMNAAAKKSAPTGLLSQRYGPYGEPLAAPAKPTVPTPPPAPPPPPAPVVPVPETSEVKPVPETSKTDAPVSPEPQTSETSVAPINPTDVSQRKSVYPAFPEKQAAPLEAATDAPDLSAHPAYGWVAGAANETSGPDMRITSMGARSYDSLLGEFSAPDPANSPSPNLVSYTAGDPINSSDLNGRWVAPSWLHQSIGAIALVAAFCGPNGMIVSAALMAIDAGISTIEMQTENRDWGSLEGAMVISQYVMAVAIGAYGARAAGKAAAAEATAVEQLSVGTQRASTQLAETLSVHSGPNLSAGTSVQGANTVQQALATEITEVSNGLAVNNAKNFNALLIAESEAGTIQIWGTTLTNVGETGQRELLQSTLLQTGPQDFMFYFSEQETTLKSVGSGGKVYILLN